MRSSMRSDSFWIRFGSSAFRERKPFSTKLEEAMAMRFARRTSRFRACSSSSSSSSASTSKPKQEKIEALPCVELPSVRPRQDVDETRVLLLGIAHVSAESVRITRKMIRETKPDIILVELCKERMELLMDDPKPPNDDTRWYSEEVKVEGFDGLPQQKLLEISGLKRGYGMTRRDIENGIRMLVATGCFDQVIPITVPADTEQVPTFLCRPLSFRTMDLECLEGFQQVNPLQILGYRVKERSLPVAGGVQLRLDGSVQAMDVSEVSYIEEQLHEREMEGGLSTIGLCCLARELILELASRCGIDANRLRTDFDNLESDNPIVCYISLSNADLPVMYTGLGSPVDYDAALQLSGSGDKGPEQQQTVQNDVSSRSANVPTGAPGRLLGDALSKSYGAVQASAGEKLGVRPGAAWRAALEEAAACGTRQFLLGDRPVSVTKTRMGTAIWSGTQPKLLGLLGICSMICMTAGLSGDAFPFSVGATVGVALGSGLLGSAWLITSPLREIAEFANQDPEEIEESVQSELRKPLEDQVMWKLDGEDALVEWEGADRTIITERDEYMAKTLHAAATSRASLSPAMIRDVTPTGDVYMRYRLGSDAPTRSNPKVGELGHGCPTYVPMEDPKTILGIVGAAHVRGIVEAWKNVEDIDLDALLSE